MVYIQEAHPSDAWQLEANRRENVVFTSPASDAERGRIAGACVRGLKIRIPALVDSIADQVERSYTGWPDRLYLINRQGRIAYKSAPGPYGFSPKELAAALRKAAGAGPQWATATAAAFASR